MELGIIIAIVGTGLAMVGVVMSMMFWARTEANGLRLEANADRKDFVQMNRNIERLVQAMDNEMKDFHYKLIEIEKGRK